LVARTTDLYSSRKQVAETADEASKLVEAGFEYVCTTPEKFMLFKIRK
jgi:hypothetical protein